MSQTITIEYTTPGEKELIIVESKNSSQILFSIKAGLQDIYSVDVQIAADSQRVSLPLYKDSVGDNVGRVPSGCYSIGLNIGENISGLIIFQLKPQ